MKKQLGFAMNVCLFCAILSHPVWAQSENNSNTRAVASRTIPDSPLLNKLSREAVSNIPLVNPLAALPKINKPSVDLAGKISIFKTSPFFKLDELDASILASNFGDEPEHLLSSSGAGNSGSSYAVRSRVSVLSVPFTTSFNGLDGFQNSCSFPLKTFGKFSFQASEYRKLLREKVLANLDPSLITATITKQITTIRQGFEQKLFNEIQTIAVEYAKREGKQLQLPSSVADLTTTDMSSYQLQLLQGSASGANLEDAARQNAVQAILSRFTKYQQAFQQNKLVRELSSQLPFTPENFGSFLQNPGRLKQIINQKVSLNSLQTLFLSLTKLDIGQFPLSTGELETKDLMNTGAQVGLESKKGLVNFAAGKSATRNQWLQQGLTSFTTNEYSGLAGLNLNSAISQSITQSFSLNFFNFQSNASQFEKDQSRFMNYMGLPDNKQAVFSWRSQLDLGRYGLMNLDLSKAFSGFTNEMTASGSVKTNSLRSIIEQKSKANTAALITWMGSLLNTDVAVNFKKVGLGYYNPGNVYLRSGETEFGLSASRRFLKQKLGVRLTSNYRNQAFDPLKEFVYRTFTTRLQTDYRWKKNNRIRVLVQHNDYQSSTAGISPTGGSADRVELNGFYSFYLSEKKIQNSITISGQKMALPYAGSRYTSRNLFLLHTSSLMVAENLLTLSLVVNRSNNTEYYFNTSSASSELTYNYNSRAKIRLASSAGYFDNTGWNRQLGVRQQFSATVGKGFDMDLEINYKKAINIVQKELANQIFLNTSFFYHFN